MSDLASWLLEQIAEDERIAQGQAEREDAMWADLEAEAKRGNVPSIALDDVFCAKRVLAECEAKRRIIERLARAVHGGDIEISPLAARDILARLSLAFADRGGYQENWRP